MAVEVPTPTKHIADGHVAVVLSNDYGLGWSSSVHDRRAQEYLLFDSQFVERVLANLPVTNPFAEGLTGSFSSQRLSNANLRVEWIPVGEKFVVVNYDGLESVVLEDEFVVA